MQSTDELRSTYNKIARDYYADHLKDTWDDDYTGFFIQLLDQHAKVLDLGCGPGIESKKLAVAGFNVTGFDLSDGLIEIARQQNPGLVFIQGDMRKLPYPEDQFDGVFAKASLLHVPKQDMENVLREVRRILKSKGLLHVAVKEERAGESEAERTESDYGYKYTRFFSYWNMPQLVSLLERCGFRIIKQTKKAIGHTVWLQVLAKRV